MGSYCYTLVNGKIPDFFSKIRNVGIPPEVTNKWLESIGFTSSNDRALRGVLKQIGFIDSSYKPTEKWNQYRGQNHSKVMANAIKEGYEELYKTYPDAHLKSEEELRSYFSTRLTTGGRALQATVGTFKALCDLADFTNMEKPDEHMTESTTKSESQNIHSQITSKEMYKDSQGINLNINIQLTLPETKDEEVYNKFFEALKKHLISVSDESE